MLFHCLDDEIDNIILIRPVQHVRRKQKTLEAIVLSVECGLRPFLKGDYATDS